MPRLLYRALAALPYDFKEGAVQQVINLSEMLGVNSVVDYFEKLPGWSYPAANFVDYARESRGIKLEGIHCEYKLPEGKSTWQYIMPGEDPRAVGKIKEIAVLNPELGNIASLDTIENASNILGGILSGFNPDDIEWYSVNKMYREESARNHDYRTLRVRVEGEVGKAMEWVPSQKTLRSIATQLDRENQIEYNNPDGIGGMPAVEYVESHNSEQQSHGNQL